MRVAMASPSLFLSPSPPLHRPLLPSLPARPASRRNGLRRARAGTRLRVAAPPSVPGEAERTEEPSTSSPESGERFVWRDHWYPVSLVEDLDPRVPTPFQLLNRDLVIWKDPNSGEWAALDDRCPHRLAPLSVRSSPRLRPIASSFQVISDAIRVHNDVSGYVGGENRRDWLLAVLLPRLVIRWLWRLHEDPPGRA